jgi:hypothetical protein
MLSDQAFSNLPLALSHAGLDVMVKPCPLQALCPLQDVLAVLHALCPLQAFAPKHFPSPLCAEAFGTDTAPAKISAAAAAARVAPDIGFIFIFDPPEGLMVAVANAKRTSAVGAAS